MATSNADVEQLIFELSASLTPSQRSAFEVAARAVLAAIPDCLLGPGRAYCALRDLQRLHYEYPPDDLRHEGARRQRRSKLIEAPPIGADDPRVGGRDRRQFQVG